MDEIITLSYGSGGIKTSRLIEDYMLPAFNSDVLNELSDGAILDVKGDIAFSTDSFVIDPYFFNGGDIGKLSVCGTVNDILMCGAVPKFLSLSFILEEGLKLEDLKTIINSIAETAKKANVKIVTGDTKVVDRGHGHGIYINTSGIGIKRPGVTLGKNRIKEGDKVIVTGSIGNHGVSILCSRENLLISDIKSDCAPLNSVVDCILKYKENIKILRDPTRGGVATTLNEFVEGEDFGIELEESSLPIDKNVQTACDLLGLDPLYSANEGKVLAIVDKSIAEKLITDLNNFKESEYSAIIGEVTSVTKGKVLIKSIYGGKRVLDKLSNDLLPRIC